MNLYNALNAQHPAISFTMEETCEHFLDVELHRDSEGRISTAIHRKETFTGLYNNYQSFCPRVYKVNLVRTLFHRARKLCTQQHLQKEIDYLYQLLENNGYPRWFIERYSSPPPPKKVSAEKKPFYFELPYYGKESELIAKNIRHQIEGGFYHLKAIPIFKTKTLTTSIAKDTVPLDHKPLVTYSFSCPCGARYCGKSERCLSTRRREHVPNWLFKSNSRPKSRQPPQSAITRHLTTCEFKMDVIGTDDKGFRVLKQAKDPLRIAIMESVTIRQQRPDLCIHKDRLFLLRLC